MRDGRAGDLDFFEMTVDAVEGLLRSDPMDAMGRFMGMLSVERELSRRYLDLAGAVFVSIGPDERVLMINRHGRECLGRPESEIVGSNWFDSFVPPGAREGARGLFRRLMSGEASPDSRQCECPVLLPDGTERTILWRNAVIMDSRGRAAAALGSGMDITSHAEALAEANELLMEQANEKKRAEFELKKLGAVMEHAASIVFITDSSGRIEYANRAFESSTGYSRDEMAGKTPCVLFTGSEECKEHEGRRAAMFSPEGWQGTMKMRARGGEELWVRGVVSPVADDGGAATHYLSVLEDITEERASSERLEYLVRHDPVTGLLNRSCFIDELTSAITKPFAPPGALLLLDIDQFKFISDSFGHGMGDEFLRRAGGLLKLNAHQVAPGGGGPGECELLLSRLSGDEFAVYLPGAGRVDAVSAAERIRKDFEGFYQDDMQCHMTVSIGMALFPEHGSTASELLTKADAAMYRAKDRGRNRFHLYSPEEREIEQMHMRLRWKERILEALREGRFEPWFQPIISLADGRVTHYEALARLREPDGTVTLPGPFIDIAERFGLVGAISRAVFTKAFEALDRLGRQGRHERICLNVSGRELGDREFLYFIRSSVFDRGLDPSKIVFEITETASISDLGRAVSFISSLKEMGSRVSLDDFGIGFTSFLYLREMQVDYIKIAGSFIKSLDRNLNDQLFVRAIKDVASGMGIKTVAEFVERREVLELLKSYGIDYAQGYMVGRPAPDIPPPFTVA